MIMVKAKLKGNKTTINIEDLKSDLEKALEKGYTIKQLLRYGINLVNEKEEITNKIIYANELLDNFIKNINNLNLVINTLTQMYSLFNMLKNELQNLTSNIAELNKSLEQNYKIYNNIINELNLLLYEIKKSREKEIEQELKNINKLLEVLEQLRMHLANNDKLSNYENDKFAQTLAKMRKILYKLIQDQ